MGNHTSRFDLNGHRILISGGASGIGAATARVMSDLGADVILIDIGEVDPVAQAIRANGGRATALRCDVTDRKAVEDMVRASGMVDGLVACAGICPWTDWMAPDWDDAFDRVIDVNIRGTINCVRAVMPPMIERKSGRIILIGSIAGQTGGLKSGIHYVASKGGLHAMVRWLARRGAPYNVLVNGLAPGAVATPMTDGQSFDTAAIPLGRLAEPNEVAWPLAFLCSPAASYITGSILAVNGGGYMAS
jgi:NAD(P)-dependent dehydrogenase (short-subunit alcohol dehydrogenase family)